MESNKHAQQLHDRATRGKILSADEQTELEQWYAEQDLLESTLFDVPASTATDTPLQRHVNAALEQLRLITQRIQELSAENDALRQEIAELRRRLAQHSTSPAA